MYNIYICEHMYFVYVCVMGYSINGAILQENEQHKEKEKEN